MFTSVSIIKLTILSALLVSLSHTGQTFQRDMINEAVSANNSSMLINVSKGDDLHQWHIINDGVMGGVSAGDKRILHDSLVFSGHLSTKYNGGFSSIYREVSPLPNTVKAVEVKLTGDGNPYQIRFRAKVMGYLVAYKADVMTTKDIQTAHVIPLSDFTATFRGRFISNAPSLAADMIHSVGFLISSKKDHDFSLAITSINFQ